MVDLERRQVSHDVASRSLLRLECSSSRSSGEQADDPGSQWRRRRSCTKSTLFLIALHTPIKGTTLYHTQTVKRRCVIAMV